MTRSPTIVLCCGEMSGDLHAAELVRRLRERMPSCRVVAMGGDRCRDAGAELIYHYRDVAILGFTGVVHNLPRLARLERRLRRAIAAADLFIPVDYPGLNLRLSEHARRHGVPVLYYISPQIWAWGAGRVDRIARSVDCMAVILPFEKALYERHGVRVEYVGHPFVVDHTLPDPLGQDARTGVGLLPGSREQEVRRILPELVGAARRMRREHQNLGFTIGRSPAVDPMLYERIVAARGEGTGPIAYDDDAVAVMRRSRLLLVASGTATLQGALMETPLVIVYKVSPVNYVLARRVVRIETIGLVNVVLGEPVAPELIQGRASSGEVAREGLRLLVDTARRDAMVERFRGLRAMLGGGGGCARVAEIAATLLEGGAP